MHKYPERIQKSCNNSVKYLELEKIVQNESRFPLSHFLQAEGKSTQLEQHLHNNNYHSSE